jgi:hypothetical protein
MTLFLDKIILLALLITSSSLAWISPHSVIHWRDSKRFSWNQLSTSTGAGAGAASVSSCQVLGGDIRRIKLENEEDGFLAKMSVPTCAAFENQKTSNDDDDDDDDDIVTRPVIRKSLEGLVPGAFLLENVLSTEECNSIIDTCEEINFENFQSGKNQHGAIQILVTFDAAEKIALAIAPFIDMQSVNSIAASMPGSNPDVEYNICGGYIDTVLTIKKHSLHTLMRVLNHPHCPRMELLYYGIPPLNIMKMMNIQMILFQD